MSSFRGGTSVLSGGTSLDIPFNLTEDDLDVEIELEELLAQLGEYTNTLGLGDRIIIQPEERGLVIRFMDNVFFDSGSAEIRKKPLKFYIQLPKY